MAKTGLIAKIDELLLDERTVVAAIADSRDGKVLEDTRTKLTSALVQLRNTDNIDQILDIERSLLQNDLDHYKTSQAMITSLQRALTEHHATMKLVACVRDPAAYQAIADGYTLPKNRLGDVPHDEARQFFRSHVKWIINMDNTCLDRAEKSVLHERRSNIRVAEHIYTGLQREALGLSQKQSETKV